MASLSFKINAETDKLNSFITSLERLKRILSGLPDGTKEFDVINSKITEVEKRMEQSMKKITEMQNKVGQTVIPTSNTSPVKQETASYDELIKTLDEVLGTRGRNISLMLQEQNTIRLVQKELSSLENIEKRGVKLNETQRARRLILTDSLFEHKQALSSLQQVVNNDIKLNQAAQGSMNEMAQTLSKMRIAYRELNEGERNSKFGQELMKNIQEADAKIKQLDSTIGNHQRNVGNYASSWNGLSMSIQQIGREMPALAYGPKIFFSAISNNLPIFADELKRAKDEYKALIAQGQKATPVWKQVVSSLFSWQTALTVGITLLTLYGDKLVKWIGNVLSARDAAKTLAGAQDDVVESMGKGNTGIGEQMDKIESLQKTWKSLGNDTAAKNKFIHDNKKGFDDLGVAINNVNNAENLLVTNTAGFIEALDLRAQAMAAQKLKIEQYEEIFKIGRKMSNEQSKEPSGWDKTWSFIWSSIFASSEPQANKINNNLLSPEAYKERRIEGYGTEKTKAENDAKSYRESEEASWKKFYDKLRDLGIKYKTNESDIDSRHLAEQKRILDELYQLRLDNQQREINLMEDGTEKKIAQIELDYKKEKQAIKKLAEGWAEKQGGTITAQQTILISTANSSIKNNRDKKESDIREKELKDLLKQYQDYDSKRREIETKYSNDIKKLEKQRTPENSTRINAAREELAYKKDEEMKQITAEFANREEEFQSWMDHIAGMSLDQLGVVLRQAQNELGNLQIAGKGGSALAVAKQKIATAEKAIKKERSKKKSDSPDKRSLKDWKDLNDVLNDVNKSFKEIGDSVGGVAGKIISEAGEITSSTLVMINGITTLADWSVRATEMTAKGVAESIQTVEKASVILAVISAAVQIATKIASLLTGKSKAERDTERLEKVTNKIVETNEIINNLIEKRIDLIKKATAAERAGLTQTTQDTINIQKKRIEAEYQKLQKNEILGKKGKNNDLDVRDIVGLDSVEGLKDFLSSERLLEYESKGYSLTDKDKWFSIVEEWDKLNEQAEQLKETVSEINTGITFDEAKDGLDDLLLSADTTFKDISDNFEGYMRQSVLKMVKSQYLDQEMKKWYDQFDQRTGDGVLSKDDVNKLQDQYENIYNSAQDKVNQMLAAAGLSLESSSEEQSATSRGFESISQDTGDELNGRFAALQMIGTEVRNQSFQQTQSIIQMLDVLSSIQVSVWAQQRTGDELLQFAVQSYMELKDINENTKLSAKYLRDIKDDIVEVKKNTSCLS